jgi:hypothetical protein
MRPEDVPQEWLRAAFAVRPVFHHRDIAAILAAVAPLIRRAALEEAAVVAASFPAILHPDFKGDPMANAFTAADEIAAAIRALDT